MTSIKHFRQIKTFHATVASHILVIALHPSTGTYYFTSTQPMALDDDALYIDNIVFLLTYLDLCLVTYLFLHLFLKISTQKKRVGLSSQRRKRKQLYSGPG